MNNEEILNFEPEHETLMKKVDNYLKSIKKIYDILQVFDILINQLNKSCLELKLNEHFKKLENIFNDFSEQLNFIIEPMDASVFELLKTVEKNINKKKDESNKIYNILKKKIKKEEALRKIDYEKSVNKDDNFNESLKKNIKEIYNYEIDSIHLNYNKLNNEINNAINNTSEINIVFYTFSNYVKHLGQALLNLDQNIKKEIKIQTKDNENINEEKKYNVNPSIINTDKTKDDFLILNNTEDIGDEGEITRIIQEIINSENKINLMKDINILDLLGIDIDKKNDKNNKEIFLSKISDLCLNGISLVKNEDNFNFLANILNVIFLQEQSKLNILSIIISISNHIKYKNIYLDEVMYKKNRLFKEKTLWTKLLNYNLINSINKYKEDILNNRNEETEKEEKDENNKIEKKSVISILKSLPLEKNNLSDFKKLSSNKKKDLYKYIQVQGKELLSKCIKIMKHFFIEDEIILEMLNNYRNKLNFDNDLVIHLQNLLLIINLNSKHKNKFIDLKSNEKPIIIISKALKFLPPEDYLKFLPLNKVSYPKMKKYFFSIIFEKTEINLDLHMKYLGEYLQISKIQKDYEYIIIKNVNNSYLEKNKDDKTINKKIELIKNDLKRTVFLQQNPNHNEAIKSILLTINFTFPDIGYYQGFNIIVSFLYQLLDYNEEKTFYYFYCLQKHTQYNKVFENNFGFLKILYSAFEKIIELNMPEIIYIIKDIKVDLDYFCSSWFTHLFIGYINIIDKDDPPLLLIYFLEKFCISGWGSIFNLGLTILEIGYEKIITLEKEELIKYIMKIVYEEKIFDNSNYQKCRSLFEKYEKIIDEYYANKLIELTKFEYKKNN